MGMTETTLHQSYFTVSEVREIVDHLISLPTAGGVSADRKVAATQALNAVRILRDRLGAGSGILGFMYTDETIVPKALARFMGEYLSGRYGQEEAEKIIDGLQADMKKNYFQRKIPFDDTSKLPRTKIFDPTGEFAKELKEIVEETIAEYDQKADRRTRAEEIYKKACNNPTGDLDFNALAGGLAEIIARKEYSSLVLSIGARDPTPPEFAGRYLDALDTAYRKLGNPNPQRNIDRESVLEQRTADEVYRRELQIYRDNIGRLFIL